MKVEFLFNGIINMDELYNVNMIDSPLGGDDKCPSYDYIGDTYCKKIIEKVILNVADAKEYSYEGSTERFANEVFVIDSTAKKYIVSFNIDTYEHEKARMQVRITSENKGITEETNRQRCVFLDGIEYDLFFEQLKIELKDVLKKDWNVCTWIVDEQSEMLCSHLYPRFFTMENKIRAFASKLLVSNLGANWLSKHGLEKYFDSHKSLSKEFTRVVACFSDIDDTFISMTMETMFEVIFKARVYENTITLTEEDYQKIFEKASQKSGNAVCEFLKSKRMLKISFWEGIFKQYFSSESDFRKATTDFIKNRNHVAHNKLLNWSGYQTIQQSINDMDRIISSANTQFEESMPSDELYMTWEAEDEAQRDAEAEADWERNYVRIRIDGETGVKILHEDSILELFSEKLHELYTEIEDSYYFNPCYKISGQSSLNITRDEQTLFSVSSNAVENSEIEIKVEFSLDGDMDGDSVATLVCTKTGDVAEELFKSNLYYHNGSGHDDALEGMVILDSESEYDGSELDDFKQQLTEYIENRLNPLIEELEGLEYEAKRHGNSEPVADFPCCECEKNGISIMEDFYTIGRCCYCGTDNEVSTCERCGTVFDDDGGKNGLCNGCIVEIDAD